MSYESHTLHTPHPMTTCETGRGGDMLSLLVRDVEAALTQYLQDPGFNVKFYRLTEVVEKSAIKWALKQAGGRQNMAAKLLGLKTSTLHAMIKRHEIVVRETARTIEFVD